MAETRSWALNVERKVVRHYGGQPNYRLDGPDGHYHNRPMEVKTIGVGDKVRIGKRDHEIMMRHNGTYVFVDRRSRKAIRISAYQADRLIKYKWLVDRDYPHGFIYRQQLFR